MTQMYSGKSGEKQNASQMNAFLVGVIAFCVLVVVAIEGGKIAYLEGAAQISSGLSSIEMGAWMTSCLAVLLACLFFWALSNRILIGMFLTSEFFGLLLFAHLMKKKAQNRPLVLSDFKLVGDLLKVTDGSMSGHLPSIVGGILLIVVSTVIIVILAKRPTRFPLTFGGRFALSTIIPAVCFLGLFQPSMNTTAFSLQMDRDPGLIDKFLGILRHPHPELIMTERESGFISHFLRSPTTTFQKPTGYGREKIQAILTNQKNTSLLSGGAEKPDVILYLCESLMDLERFVAVRFDKDPMPNLHALMRRENVFSGRLTSPEVGGMTANVEYELLTGLPLSALPLDVVPFYHDIVSKTDSLTHAFARAGRMTVAFHNYLGSLYRYREAYPLLGFEDFLDIERLPTTGFSGAGKLKDEGIVSHPVLFEGGFPSDEILVRGIENFFAENADRSVFAYGLTIVAHGKIGWDVSSVGAYPGWPEDEKTVRVVGGNFSDKIRESIEHVANAQNRSDVSLGRIADFVLSREKPTILFALGDHMPFISESVRDAAGLDFGPDGRRKYDVPFFVLANYPLPKIEIPDGMSIFFLPAKILRAAGVDGGPYFQFLESKLTEVTALTHHVIIFPDGREYSGLNDPVMPPEDAARVKKLIDDFTMLTWDRLAGEGFSTVLGVSPYPKDSP